MMEICGSTTDCNRFASDDTIGANSLFKQKDKNIYRITGMISFGSLKISNDADTYGHVEIDDYMDNVRTYNKDVVNYKGISAAIRAELENVAGNINRVIDMIGTDEKIKYCVEGRDLKQITGKDGATDPRFPNLLNQVKMQIAVAALRQAQNNYQTKYNKLLAEATQDASADIAQYMCQMLPVSGGAPVGAVDEKTALTAPYAISYDVGAGLNNNLLAQGGHEQTSIGGGEIVRGKNKIDILGGKREVWSTFNRETRVCRLCSLTVTKDCQTVINWFKSASDCTESDPIEKCEDIQM